MKSRPVRNRIRDYLELGKIKIMIPVSLTGFTGFFIYNPVLTFRILLVSLGILLLGVSASILNQLQEADPDSRMERTQYRPIPSQRIKPQQALIFLLCNLIAGIILIYSAGNLTAVIIGLIAIGWYNGIYTYAKKITAFAVFPGAVTGALPPLIGWVAAGQRGELILPSVPGTVFPLTVTRITPISTAKEGRNYFRVEAELQKTSERLRPGMEGVGKISTSRRRLIWICTHDVMEWIRLKAWSWWP